VSVDNLAQNSRIYSSKEDHVKNAEQKLRVIEKITKYREEKIKKEFLKLEEELKREEDKIKIEK
jgi:hypothetical protein